MTREQLIELLDYDPNTGKFTWKKKTCNKVVVGREAGGRNRASNNTSGFKGVSWHKAARKWSSSIYLNGKPNHLGLFESAEEAHAAYMAAATRAHPEFARAA